MSVVEMALVETPKFNIYVASDDQLIGGLVSENKAFEPHVTDLVERLLKPGDVFLDLGANIGIHTLAAAWRVGDSGRCIAIDMVPENCACLRASCDANGFHHVEVIEGAVNDVSGRLSFYLTPGTYNGALVTDAIRASMAENPQFFGEKDHPVQAIAIDDVVGENDRVDLVKMDIEGAEAKAIKGMRRLLTRQRPPIIFEFFPNLLWSTGEIEPVVLLDMLRSFGYQMYRIHPDSSISPCPLSNDEAMAAVTLPDGSLGWVDLLASPVERGDVPTLIARQPKRGSGVND
jgi:FkbM family methyltransferase